MKTMAKLMALAMGAATENPLSSNGNSLLTQQESESGLYFPSLNKRIKTQLPKKVWKKKKRILRIVKASRKANRK